jgi:hypothetical protein
VREEILQENPEEIKKLLEVINKQTQSFKSIPNIDAVLANQFNQKIEDIQQWLKLTQWSQSPFNEAQLETIQNQLLELNIIDKKAPFINLVKAL